MKRFILIFFLLQSYLINACDYCNCYLGLNPHYKLSRIGLRYHQMNYSGSHHELSEFSDHSLSTNDFWENRSTVELHGQWYPVQKLQIVFSLPYIYNAEGMSEKAEAAIGQHTHDEESGNGISKGIGDPFIIAHYQLFNRTNSDSTKFSQRLFAGAGIKAPMGSYRLGMDAEASERVHQPGTGSWDIISSATYLGKLNSVGCNLNASYMLTNPNDEDFQFGNKLNVNAIIYYEWKLKKIHLYPSIGAYYEQANPDRNQGEYVDNSGGSIVYAHTGIDFYYKRFSINTAFQIPVSQALHSPQPEIIYRLITGVSFAFDR